ncbi:VPLPA-CTERM sorting domain-containing protein [Pseudooceanicola nitratireducens]|uniref:VPLPA-CTERM sorting domain-containing protein n=1 Tax=Pseudooceanicola nitratireducens TaxID=517719 RepID=UPI003C7C40DA
MGESSDALPLFAFRGFSDGKVIQRAPFDKVNAWGRHFSQPHMFVILNQGVFMIHRSISIALAGLLLAAPASATIVGGGVTSGPSGATFYKLDINSAGNFEDTGGTDYGTNDVGNNTFQLPHLFGFDEGQNISLTADVAVNIGSSPLAGGFVASHYVFFDPGPTQDLVGYVDFDSDIFGIATLTAQLFASDWLARSDVDYLNPGARGLESGQDSVWIDPTNSKRLMVDLRASTPGDYVRVFTDFSPAAAVPLPAGLPLMAGAFAALGWLRRRKS